METIKHSRPVPSILVVEDEPVTRELLSTVISQKLPDVVLHTAENGEVGLEMFREHRPDIVLTDISMPVMDGIQMARTIRVLNPSAIIIAATAKSDMHHLLDAIKIGISRYVLKPIDLKMLFEAIDDCLARITLERQIKAQNDFIRKLSRAVEQSPSMVMITDARGAIEYVNSKFTRITGYTPEEIMGQNLRILLSNTTPLDTFEMLWSTITRGFEWRGEFMNLKKDGELYYLDIFISPLTTEEGDITHFVAVMEDISKRKEAEEKIRRLNEELEQRVKERTAELEASNQELEAFCYSVAHDLSAPLRGMSGFSTMLQEDYAGRLDDTGKEYLVRIGSAAGRMGQLITDLLDLSRVTRSKLRRERVNLSALAHEIVEELRKQEPERRVEVVVSEGVEADGDPILVRLVLENLLDNAWKYTGKEPSPSVEFGSSSIEGETVYFVRDNGIGFDMVYASKLFIPFQRLHRIGEFEGTGVGLATVQRIVTRHGGKVWAEGEVEKGATFYFTLG